MRAGRQIQAVVDALEAAGIESVLLKGPALARTVYPDPALRQSVDIDLLVRPGDVIAAEGVLEGLGYHCPTKYFHLTPTASNNETFDAPGDGVPVEVHWLLDFALNLFSEKWLEDVFARRVPVRADGLAFDTLSPADHLLYLAFHNGFQHNTFRLDWASDTALLMSAFGTAGEWGDLIQTSLELHARIPLELTTTVAALWAGGKIPEEAGDYSAWPAPTERELQLWDHAPAHHNSLVSYVWLIMQGQRGPLEKIRWGWRFILPPTPMLEPYRKSTTRIDIPLAHLRRWTSIMKYF